MIGSGPFGWTDLALSQHDQRSYPDSARRPRPYACAAPLPFGRPARSTLAGRVWRDGPPPARGTKIDVPVGEPAVRAAGVAKNLMLLRITPCMRQNNAPDRSIATPEEASR